MNVVDFFCLEEVGCFSPCFSLTYLTFANVYVRNLNILRFSKNIRNILRNIDFFNMIP